MDHEILFLPSQRRVRVPAGTTLLAAAQRAGLPVASACGAHAMCGRCGMQLVEGGADVAPADERELQTMRDNRVDGELRLACRVSVTADLIATTRYW